MENTLLYGEKGEVPEEEYTDPAGRGRHQARGRATYSLIAHGRAVIACLEAAEKLQAEHGIQRGGPRPALDPPARPGGHSSTRSRKTNRAVLVEENKPFCGVGAQIASTIQEQAFDYLDAPVKRVSSIDAPAIYSPPLEEEQLPHAGRIIDKVLTLS